MKGLDNWIRQFCFAKQIVRFQLENDLKTESILQNL